MNSSIEKMVLRAVLSAVVILAVVWLEGCGQTVMPEDDLYLTPIPQATLDAYKFGEPVTTRLEAVLAATREGLSFHLNPVREPVVIYAEKMKYQDALKRVEQPGVETVYDPRPRDQPVWLVVFQGEWTITGPLGTETAPRESCAFVLVEADDGGMIQSALPPCDWVNMRP